MLGHLGISERPACSLAVSHNVWSRSQLQYELSLEYEENPVDHAEKLNHAIFKATFGRCGWIWREPLVAWCREQNLSHSKVRT